MSGQEKDNLVHKEGRYRIVRRADDSHLLQITATIGGKRYRIGAGTDLRQAKLRLHDFMAEMEAGYKPSQRGDDVSWRSISDVMVRRQRNAARARGIPFEVNEGVIYDLMREAGFRCCVSGIALSKMRTVGDVDPWAPSIDRIDSRQGYILDNVRVVCMAANYAMNRWGLDMLIRLAGGVVRNARIAAINPDHVDFETLARSSQADLKDTPFISEISSHDLQT